MHLNLFVYVPRIHFLSPKLNSFDQRDQRLGGVGGGAVEIG